MTVLSNKTEARGAIDDTSNDGVVALSGVSASDTGYVMVLGF